MLVTQSHTVQEAVLVLMTDPAAETSAQVLRAARQLPKLLRQLPAAQVGVCQHNHVLDTLSDVVRTS